MVTTVTQKKGSRYKLPIILGLIAVSLYAFSIFWIVFVKPAVA